MRLLEPLRALPPLTVATAAMYGSGSVLLVAGAVTWVPGKNPRWVITSLAVAAVVFFVWTVVRGRKFSPTEALVMTVFQLAVIGRLTWTTHLTLGAFANGTVLPIVGVYVIWFLRPVSGRITLYLGTIWWFVAITHQHDGSLLPFAASVVVQTVIATEVFSRVKARMDHLARTDPLTGILNRRGITEVLEREFRRAVRRGQSVSVVAVDLDGLREVNNTLGHRAGDELLETVTQHWAGHVRRRDQVGRTGGDEFLFVLPTTDRDEAERFVKRLTETSPGSWSAGVAVVKPGDSLMSLLDRADRRMYSAKESRRGTDMPVERNGTSVNAWTMDPMSGMCDQRTSPMRPPRRSAS
jgi:diguanylate cyclase (GGDEF)-like protein